MNYNYDNEITAVEANASLRRDHQHTPNTPIRNGATIEMDESQSNMLAQGSRVVHQVGPRASRCKKSLPKHAGAVVGQFESLHPRWTAGAEAHHKTLDDQQTERIHMHTSRPTKKTYCILTFSSKLLTIRTSYDCRQVRLQLLRITFSDK